MIDAKNLIELTKDEIHNLGFLNVSPGKYHSLNKSYVKGYISYFNTDRDSSFFGIVYCKVISKKNLAIHILKEGSDNDVIEHKHILGAHVTINYKGLLDNNN